MRGRKPLLLDMVEEVKEELYGSVIDPNGQTLDSQNIKIMLPANTIKK